MIGEELSEGTSTAAILAHALDGGALATPYHGLIAPKLSTAAASLLTTL